MITLLILASYLLANIYFYVQSVKNAMNKHKWLAAGLVLGPLLMPMFNISKQMQLRKAIGYKNAYFSA